MSTLALAVAILLGIAAATFFVAGGLYGRGSPWAMDLCYSADAFCRHPEWIAYATAAAALAYFWLRRGEV